MKISVIVVTYNSDKYISKFLNTFFNFEPNFVYEIILIDNKSTDRTVEIVKNYKKVKLIIRDKLYSFSNNNNFGAKFATGDILAFLNPDIYFIDNSLKYVFDLFIKYPSVGIIGPKLLNDDQTVQYSARKFINISILISRLLYLGKDTTENKVLKTYFQLSNYDENIFVDWVTGAALFVKKKIFMDDIGGFDEAYRLYIEDEDLCLMALRRGWYTLYTNKITLVHSHQRISIKKLTKKTLYHFGGILIFLFKSYTGIYRLKKLKN